MWFNFLGRKFGKNAWEEVAKDKKAKDALLEAMKDIWLEQGEEGIDTFKQWRSDLRPEDDTTKYPEDDD